MSSGKVYPSLVKGKVYEWTPLKGIDPGLGEKIMWIASAWYAKEKSEGTSEALAQQRAERLAFKTAYGVGYVR